MNKIRLIALAVVLAGILTSCEGCDDTYTPHVPHPVTITQTTTPALAFSGAVTISTSDQYTDVTWAATVASVVTAFNAAYNAATGPAQGRFSTAFAANANGHIVLVNNLAHNWEVRDGEFSTMYLKTGSIATADYSLAITRMTGSTPEVGNAAPAQRGVFLAGGVNHGGQRGKAA